MMEAARAKPRLIIALDVSDLGAAEGLVRALRPAIDFFKIGSQLFTAAGPASVSMVLDSGADVFLDLKFHDIPETVARGAEAATRLGVNMFNVHALGGLEMMRRAAERARETAAGLGRCPPAVIAVTLLTSADAATAQEVGLTGTAASIVGRLAALTRAAGLDGVVASAHELPAIRDAAGADFLTVVPGIRPEGAPRDDQARVATPRAAASAGASHIVVGRPITKAADPLAAARATLNQL